MLHAPPIPPSSLTHRTLRVCLSGAGVQDWQGRRGRRQQQERAAGVHGVRDRVSARGPEPGARVPAERRAWGLPPGKQQRSGLHLDAVLQKPGQDGAAARPVRLPGQDEQVRKLGGGAE